VELGADGVTIAIITHDQEVADAAPRTIEIRDGTVIADQTKLPTVVAGANHA